MQYGATPLIRLEGVRKLFYSDGVDTHALRDVHLEVGTEVRG